MISWFRSSIVHKLWLVTSATAIGLLALVFVTTWYFTGRQVTHGALDQISAIAATLVSQVDGDGVMALTERLPDKDAVTSATGVDARFTALIEPLTAAHAANQLATPIYTMAIAPEHVAAVQAAPNQVHAGVMEFILMSGDDPFYRHRDDYRPEMAAALFEGQPVRVAPYTSQNGRWVSALQPLRASDGSVIGFLEVDQQLDALLAETRNQLWVRSIPLLLLAALAIIAGWLVSKRIAARLLGLEGQARRFADGDYQTAITCDGHDEVTSVAQALEAGRVSIDEFISRILGTMPGVLVTVDTELTLGRYASHEAAAWFDGQILGQPATALFSAPAAASAFTDAAGMAFDADMPLPFADSMGLAPQRLVRGDQTWTLQYHPIEDDNGRHGMLMVGQDVTEALRQKARADAETARQRLLMMVAGQRQLFDSHLDECRAGLARAGELFDAGPTPAVVNELFRIVHTIKGGSASLHMDQTAAVAHELESRLDELRSQPEPESLDGVPEGLMELEVAIDEAAAFIADALGGDDDAGVFLADDEYAQLQTALAGGDLVQARGLLAQAELPAVDRVLASKASAVFARANEVVDKAARLEVDTATTRAAPAVQRLLGGVLPHLVRNALDHGLEDDGAVRTAAGKAEEGVVRVTCHRDGAEVVLEVGDDGGGIDPQRLADRAIAKGVLSAEAVAELDDQARIELVFHPGFSTAEAVTAVSGRGVGMDAVRSDVERAGGQVRLRSTVGVGTTMQIRVPAGLAS